MNSEAAKFDTSDLKKIVELAISEVPDGPALDEHTRILTVIAVRSAVTTMDVEGAGLCIDEALELGLTAEQIQEALTVVSGLGVHTLFESTRQLADAVQRRAGDVCPPLDAAQEQLLARYVGNDPYWQRMQDVLPGFFDSLVRMSPSTFEAFFAYCAVPWKNPALRAVTKELISLAVDSTPTHRYKPGFVLHLKNALDLGAGARAIREILEISAAGPPHRGVG